MFEISDLTLLHIAGIYGAGAMSMYILSAIVASFKENVGNNDAFFKVACWAIFGTIFKVAFAIGIWYLFFKWFHWLAHSGGGL